MKTRVLLVEDEGIILNNLMQMLKHHNYEISGFTDAGNEAISLASLLSPDIVLMDITLDGYLDGIFAADYILNTLNIPVIFITAHLQSIPMEKIKAINPYGFILKPFRENEIIISIEMALERHEFNKILKQSESKYKNLVKSIPDIVYSINSEGVIDTINKNECFLNNFGYSLNDIIGQRFIDLIHQDDRNKVTASFNKKIEEKREFSRGLEFRILMKNGAIRWYELNSHTAYDKNGNLTREDGVLRDVTEKKDLHTILLRNFCTDNSIGIYDCKTGLTILGKELKNAQRSFCPLTVCVIKIAIQNTADETGTRDAYENFYGLLYLTLLKTIRQSDVICRYDKFVDFFIILPSCGITQVRSSFIERISSRIENVTALYNDHFEIRMMSGFAEYDFYSMTCEKLIESAISDLKYRSDFTYKAGLNEG